MPLILGQHIDPEPDIAIVAGSPRDATAHPTTASLVIEISDTALHYDTTTKLELYATAAVPEYWLFDLNARTLLAFRDPGPDMAGVSTYRTRLTLAFTDTIARGRGFDRRCGPSPVASAFRDLGGAARIPHTPEDGRSPHASRP